MFVLHKRAVGPQLLAQFLATKIGAEFMGRVSGVVKSGLFVRLIETGADGFIGEPKAVARCVREELAKRGLEIRPVQP